MLNDIVENRLHSRGAEQFVHELARQAILRDDSMMEREVGYHGFGTAPLLSDSLFAQAFIIESYDPLDSFRFMSGDTVSATILKRFNNATEKSLAAIMKTGVSDRLQIAYSIQDYYKSAFANSWSMRKKGEFDHKLAFEMHNGLNLAIEMAEQFLVRAKPNQVAALYVNDPTQYRHDLLESLVEIIFEALASISNGFKGHDDEFWLTAMEAIHKTFPSIGQHPDGMTPLQQRLALKIIKKLQDNMKGLYPSICRILLACIGPYHHEVEPKNRAAFTILKEAMYFELQSFPQLVERKPDKFGDFLPDNVSYDVVTKELTHTYFGGTQVKTNLATLNLLPVSLLRPKGNS